MCDPTSPQSSSESYVSAVAAQLDEARRLRKLARRPPDSLPVRPNLDFYRQQAKRLHKAERATNPSANLYDAQLAIARGVGFPSWPKLAYAIHDRKHWADELGRALHRRDQKAIERIVREHPHSLLDAGSVAATEELALLLEPPLRRSSADDHETAQQNELVPLPCVLVSTYDYEARTKLLDAVAEHHDPDGLDECILMILDCSPADTSYAFETIWERWRTVVASPNGAVAAEMFMDAIGVLSAFEDVPDYEYMPDDD